MKNAMKKIMGLLLVAVLLVSVVPFQALAVGDSVTLNLTVNGETKTITNELTGADSTAGQLAWYWYLKDAGYKKEAVTYESVTVTHEGGAVTNASPMKDTKVLPGDTVAVTVTATKPEAPTTEPTETSKPVETTAPATTAEPSESKQTTGDTNNGIDDQADAPTTIKVNIKVETNGVKKDVKSFKLEPENKQYAEVGDILSYGWNKDWKSAYTFDHAWSKERQKNLSLTDIVNVGDTLSFLLKTGASSNNNNSSSNSGSSNSGSSNSGTSNKFPYKVYLHVYLNNNIGEPDRNINITNTLATDGVVSMSEVKNLIPDYYKAKNSNGIGYDGLYVAQGNWVKDYVTDANKYTKLTDVDVRKGEEYVHINVMITNATAKTSSTADTSNPKTGDAIFMTITVMGLSAAALTGLYFYDRKRKVL